jgi:hypothetical protein
MLRKVGTRYFTYLEITHPVDRILVVDGGAPAIGRMTANASVAGAIGCARVALGNSSPTGRRRSSRADLPQISRLGANRDRVLPSR